MQMEQSSTSGSIRVTEMPPSSSLSCPTESLLSSLVPWPTLLPSSRSTPLLCLFLFLGKFLCLIFLGLLGPIPPTSSSFTTENFAITAGDQFKKKSNKKEITGQRLSSPNSAKGRTSQEAVGASTKDERGNGYWRRFKGFWEERPSDYNGRRHSVSLQPRSEKRVNGAQVTK